MVTKQFYYVNDRRYSIGVGEILEEYRRGTLGIIKGEWHGFKRASEHDAPKISQGFLKDLFTPIFRETDNYNFLYLPMDCVEVISD